MHFHSNLPASQRFCPRIYYILVKNVLGIEDIKMLPVLFYMTIYFKRYPLQYWFPIGAIHISADTFFGHFPLMTPGLRHVSILSRNVKV